RERTRPRGEAVHAIGQIASTDVETGPQVAHVAQKLVAQADPAPAAAARIEPVHRGGADQRAAQAAENRTHLRLLLACDENEEPSAKCAPGRSGDTGDKLSFRR